LLPSTSEVQIFKLLLRLSTTLLTLYPSLLHVLINYHYLTWCVPLYFITHLFIIYTFSFLSFSSLIACMACDPGLVPDAKSEDVSGGGGGRASISVT
jgi:palmitoyltransferase ZDHHC2/15/20